VAKIIEHRPGEWLLYLLECEDGTYYAGITNDLIKRFDAHCSGFGARYTRSHPPKRVLAALAFVDRASASRAEYALKQLPRAEKLAYFA
jgi:putative endonuclease